MWDKTLVMQTSKGDTPIMDTIKITAKGPMPTMLDRRGQDHGPVDGPCAIVQLSGLKDSDGNAIPASTHIHPTGGGRDPRSNEEIRQGFEEDNEVIGMSFKVIAFYDSIIDAHHAHPDAQPVSVANGVIARHQRSVKITAMQTAWREAVQASGREVCDRCGGVGGHAGWPGYTCYGCGGRGSVSN